MNVSSVIRKMVFVLSLASFQMHLMHMILYRWGCSIKARMTPFEFFMKGTLISFKIFVPVFGSLRFPIVVIVLWSFSCLTYLFFDLVKKNVSKMSTFIEVWEENVRAVGLNEIFHGEEEIPAVTSLMNYEDLILTDVDESRENVFEEVNVVDEILPEELMNI